MSVVGVKSPGGSDDDEQPVLEGLARADHFLGRQPPQQPEPPAPRSGSRLRSLRDAGAGAGPSYTYQPSRLRISLSDSALLNLLDRDDDESGSGAEGSGESGSARETSAADEGAPPTQSGRSAFPDGDAAPARGGVRALTDAHDVPQRRHSDSELSLSAGERRFTAADLQDLCAQKLSNPSLQRGLHRQLLLHRLSRRFSAEEARLRSQRSARRRRNPPAKPLVDLGPSSNSSVWQLDGPASAPAQRPTTSGRKAKRQAKEMRRTKSEGNAATGDGGSSFPPMVSAVDVPIKKGFRERLLTMLDVIPSRKSANSRKATADNPVHITDEADKPTPDQPLSPAKRSSTSLHTPKLVRSRRVKPFSMRPSEDIIGSKGTAGRRRWSTFAGRAADWQFVLRRLSAGDVVVGTEKFAAARRREPDPEKQPAPPPAGDPESAREAVDEPDGGKTDNRPANASSWRTGDVDDGGGGIRPRNAGRAEQRLHPNCEIAQKLCSTATGAAETKVEIPLVAGFLVAAAAVGLTPPCEPTAARVARRPDAQAASAGDESPSPKRPTPPPPARTPRTPENARGAVSSVAEVEHHFCELTGRLQSELEERQAALEKALPLQSRQAAPPLQ